MADIKRYGLHKSTLACSLYEHPFGLYVLYSDHIAAATAAVAAEREACAKACDDEDRVEWRHGGETYEDGYAMLSNAAQTIRARGDKT